jgi:hypothetical protein
MFNPAPPVAMLSGGFFRRAQILSEESAVSDPRATPAEFPETFPEGRNLAEEAA